MAHRHRTTACVLFAGPNLRRTVYRASPEVILLYVDIARPSRSPGRSASDLVNFPSRRAKIRTLLELLDFDLLTSGGRGSGPGRSRYSHLLADVGACRDAPWSHCYLSAHSRCCRGGRLYLSMPWKSPGCRIDVDYVPGTGINALRMSVGRSVGHRRSRATPDLGWTGTERRCRWK